MHKLMEYVCKELEELERKAEKEGKLSAAEIEYADKLTHIKKNLLRADELWQDSEYSEDSGMGGSYYSRRGRLYRNSYDDRYARRGSYDDGTYENGNSMARGRNARRDSMGRYSRGDKSEMIEELQELMQDAPDERTKQEFQRFITKMEQM